jgi:outer membrane biosynthesis protein TonB
MKKAPDFIILLILVLFQGPLVIYAQEFIPAQPRGGEWLAKQFIMEEMVYPPEALNKSLEGNVIFDFIVKEQGSVDQLTFRSHIDPLLENEASRIFKLIIWQPAQYRGKAVESKASIEIPFNLKRYKRACRERGYQTIEIPDIPIDSSGKVYLYKYTDHPPTPVFESKDKNFQSFLAENFVYPDEAFKKNITGIVKLNFIVEPHGHISNLMVIEHLGAGCTEEAIRLIKLLKWTPGLIDGRAVRVNITIPIKFGLANDGNYKVSVPSGGTTFQ